MQSNWDVFYSRVLKDEGTYFTDVPGDNGGPTNCGVTIWDVARFHGVKLPNNCKLAQLRKLSVYPGLLEKTKALNPSTAAAIYKRYYWDDIRADELPSGVDYMMADYATNSGVGRAVPTLYRLVGLPSQSTVSNALITQLGKENIVDLINHYQDARQSFLIAISNPNSPTYAHNYKFRNGWLARVKRVRDVSIEMARAAAPVDVPVAAQTAAPKAVAEIVPNVPSKLAVAAKSKSVRHAVYSIGWGVAAKVQAICLLAAGAARSTIDSVPDIYGAASDQKQAFIDMGNAVGTPEIVATVFGVLSVLSALVVIYRHVNDKHELAEVKANAVEAVA